MTDAVEVRREERSRLAVAISESAARHGGAVVLIRGEAGMGKSHLGRAVVDDLGGAAARVAWGRADPVERSVPYAALGQALRTLVLRDGPLGWGAPLGTGADPSMASVHHSVAAALLEWIDGRPALIAIDDLHHADDDTIQLLGFLIRRLAGEPVSWVLTARPHVADPTPLLDQVLQRLDDDGRLIVLDLAPLDDDAIRAVAEQAVGSEIPAEVAAQLARRSAGNPFFAIQLALSIPRGATVGAPSLPDVSRRGALLNRVFPLGDVARRVARLASVCGSFDLAELEGSLRSVELTVDAARDGLDRLVRADIVRARPDGRYEFVHDLIAETLYADLGPGERRRLHGAVGLALLGRRLQGFPSDVVDLARHLSEAAVGPNADAADALIDAGDALAGPSPRSAIVRYRQALAHLPDGSPARSRLQVKLAGTLHRAGDASEVVALCRHGLASAVGEERPLLVRYLAGGLADDGDFEGALAVVDRELAEGGAQPVLWATRSMLLRLTGRHPEAIEAVDRAEALVTSPAERLAALFQRLYLDMEVVDVPRGADAAVELERLLPSLDPVRRRLAVAHLAALMGARGELGRLREHLRSIDALDEEGTPDADWVWAWHARILLSVRTGAWDDAVARYGARAGDLTTGLGRLLRSSAVFTLREVPVDRGDRDLHQRLLADVVPLNTTAWCVGADLQAGLDVALGRTDDALVRLDDALARLPQGSQVALWVGLHRLQLLWERHAHQVDAELVHRVLELAGRQGTPSVECARRLSVARFLDDPDAARGALEMCQAQGFVAWEAQAHLELGRLGVRPGEHLPAAHEIFRGLGAAHDERTTEAEMRRHGIRVRSRRRVDRYALTDAEERVAGLVASGLTNRAIAEQLAYSVKTIESYLSRIYAKTGCANRVELARRIGDAAHPR